MDDFDIEMGDAFDIPMEEEHQVADILIGDDLQVRQYQGTESKYKASCH